MFERHGVDLSRKTMGGWLAQCAYLLQPLYGSLKEVLFQSKVIGTDDTSVKVLDIKLPFARTGRIWPYYGTKAIPCLYDYTTTRERTGPEAFLKGYRGYLQADAYSGYHAFFKNPARGLIEVGCWAHARHHLYKALQSDQARMGPALLLIAQLCRVEQQARPMAPKDRLQLRQRQSRPILDKLHDYLAEIQVEVLPKSPEGRAVRYTLKNWTALTATVKTETWRSITTQPKGRSAAWRSAAAIGCSLAATGVAKRRRFCGASWLPASGPE
jgi:hypothetical protein